MILLRRAASALGEETQRLALNRIQFAPVRFPRASGRLQLARIEIGLSDPTPVDFNRPRKKPLVRNPEMEGYEWPGWGKIAPP